MTRHDQHGSACRDEPCSVSIAMALAVSVTLLLLPIPVLTKSHVCDLTHEKDL